MLGPLLISCFLCFGIIDYTVYRETNSSPLSWLWNSLAYIFRNLPISSYLTLTNLLLFGSILLLGILITTISLRNAMKAMETKITDDFISRTDKISKLKEASAGNIFISYRPDDNGDYAHLLYDRLNQRFPGRVFMDVNKINPGTDFVRVIEDTVGSCDALIAVLGKHWLSTTGSQRSLGAPADLVRLEIAGALRRDMRVIPVLLQDATMPSATELPEDISPLARRQAVALSDADLDGGVARLIGILETEFGEKAVPQLIM